MCLGTEHCAIFVTFSLDSSGRIGLAELLRKHFRCLGRVRNGRLKRADQPVSDSKSESRCSCLSLASADRHRHQMSGQTISDRLLAARHSIAGQGLAKSVCKATTEEVIGPKKKHLDCEYPFRLTPHSGSNSWLRQPSHRSSGRGFHLFIISHNFNVKKTGQDCELI